MSRPSVRNFNPTKFSRRQLVPVLVILFIAVAGTIVLSRSHAATPFLTAEPDAGTIVAPASKVTDATASGGSALKFAAATTPTPSPTPTPPAGGCSGAANTPGGADPWGGCFPGPASTGTPSGTSLSNYTGPMTISTSGTVIDGKLIKGQLTVATSNVTIRNSRVESSDYYGIVSTSPNLIVEDTTFIGAQVAALVVYDSGTLTARRVNVSGSQDGIRMAGASKLYDSYVHDLEGPPESHFDSVTADGFRGWEITHNTILNQNSQTAAVWIGDPRYAASEGLLNRNLLAGGGYTVYAGPGTGLGLRVIDNIFSRMYFPKVGGYGPVASWTSANNTWTGNKYNDGTAFNQ